MSLSYPKSFFRTCLVSLACFLAYPSSQAQTIIYQESFESNNGSFTASVEYPGGGSANTVNPWTYGNQGLGGSLGWSTNGGQVGRGPSQGGIPFEMWLTSPAITVTGTGDLTLQFDHSYNFEYEAQGNAYWDGGVIMVSVNGGTFNQLDSSAFLQNGYNGILQNEYDWGYADDFNNQEVFGDSSGGYVTSIATLGSFIGGDTVSIRFRGGWDWHAIDGAPNWAVDNVELSLTAVPEPATIAVHFASTALIIVFYRKRKMAKRLS